MKKYYLTDINYFKIHGRTTSDLKPLNLFWSGSGLELACSGTQLWVNLNSDYKSFEPWLIIKLNDEFISRQMVTKGRHKICVYRGMSANVIKKVEIIKDTQAMSGDSNHCLQIESIVSDGSFHECTTYPMKIEFIGDSITCGEGAIGAKCESDWTTMFKTTHGAYPEMVSKHFNAQFNIIAQSGWGICAGWDNNPNTTMPEIYDKVCGVLNGRKNFELGANELHNFSKWQPDIIVINLGTNDDSAFNQTEFIDEFNVSHKLEFENENHKNKFIKKAETFIKNVRENNKNAHIVWCYGMLGTRLKPLINEAILNCKDDNIDFLLLDEMTENTVGSLNHPGQKNHAQASEKLIKYIENLKARNYL